MLQRFSLIVTIERLDFSIGCIGLLFFKMNLSCVIFSFEKFLPPIELTISDIVSLLPYKLGHSVYCFAFGCSISWCVNLFFFQDLGVVVYEFVFIELCLVD